MKNKKILFLTQFSLLLAIEAIVCFTPLGSLPIVPLALVATLSHIPVIITALTLGTYAGTLMGGFFGLFSFIVWTFMPPTPLMAFVFTPFYSFGTFKGNALSILICFVPRILIGVVSGVLFKICEKINKNKNSFLSYILSGAAGSLVNTLLVLGGIYIFFGKQYAEVNEVAFEALFGIMGVSVLTNGVLELALAAIVSYVICKPLNKYINRGWIS